MKKNNYTLLIPVENQVRELDPKLLLACIGATRGFSSLIGFRREMHFHLASFPRGIYLSKSVTAASDMMFEIMRKFGHAIVAYYGGDTTVEEKGYLTLNPIRYTHPIYSLLLPGIKKEIK